MINYEEHLIQAMLAYLKNVDNASKRSIRRILESIEFNEHKNTRKTK
jgi:hypothetical protein